MKIYEFGIAMKEFKKIVAYSDEATEEQVRSDFYDWLSSHIDSCSWCVPLKEDADARSEMQFRAKRMDCIAVHPTWVYGRYFTQPPMDDYAGSFPESGWLNGSDQRHCIEQDGIVIPIDVKTLGRYTGIKDACGKAIYQDDVLEVACDCDATNYTTCIHPETVVVRWIPERQAFELHDSGGQLAQEKLNNENDHRYELVGNTHDDLLFHDIFYTFKERDPA